MLINDNNNDNWVDLHGAYMRANRSRIWWQEVLCFKFKNSNIVAVLHLVSIAAVKCKLSDRGTYDHYSHYKK